MDHPDFIVCNCGKVHSSQKGKGHAQLHVYREASSLILDLNIYLSTFFCLGVMAAITKFSCQGLFDCFVHSAPSIASQPISLHRNLNFGQLYHIFCQDLQYQVSKVMKSVK